MLTISAWQTDNLSSLQLRVAMRKKRNLIRTIQWYKLNRGYLIKCAQGVSEMSTTM